MSPICWTVSWRFSRSDTALVRVQELMTCMYSNFVSDFTALVDEYFRDLLRRSSPKLFFGRTRNVRDEATDGRENLHHTTHPTNHVLVRRNTIIRDQNAPED